MILTQDEAEALLAQGPELLAVLVEGVLYGRTKIQTEEALCEESCSKCSKQFKKDSGVVVCLECKGTILLCEDCGVQALAPNSNEMILKLPEEIGCKPHHQKQRFRSISVMDDQKAKAAFIAVQGENGKVQFGQMYSLAGWGLTHWDSAVKAVFENTVCGQAEFVERICELRSQGMNREDEKLLVAWMASASAHNRP